MCDASEVPWTDKKIDERIRAFRADARGADPDVSPEVLAEIITFTFGTVLASVYGQSNAEEVAHSRYRVELAPPSSPAHARALSHIENSALRWIRLTESAEDLVGSGRRGPAIADQLAALGGWLHAHSGACTGYGPVRGGPAPMGSVAIKPLVPARISLPERGACFDLAAWLPEPIKSEYRTPALIRQRDVPRAPRSRVHAHDWPAVVRRYDDSRMVLLAREERGGGTARRIWPRSAQRRDGGRKRRGFRPGDLCPKAIERFGTRERPGWFAASAWEPNL